MPQDHWHYPGYLPADTRTQGREGDGGEEVWRERGGRERKRRRKRRGGGNKSEKPKMIGERAAVLAELEDRKRQEGSLKNTEQEGLQYTSEGA